MINKYVTTRVMNNMTITESFGQAKIKFEFERGNTARGIAAAYYTNDPFRQRVLEKSQNFGVLYRLAETIMEDGDSLPDSNTVDAETPATVASKTTTTSSKSSMKDMKFSDAAEAIVFVMNEYGEQCDSQESAVKVLKKHKINAIIG